MPDEEKPLYEFRSELAGGHHIKIWRNGKLTSNLPMPEDTQIINRIPQLVSELATSGESK